MDLFKTSSFIEEERMMKMWSLSFFNVTTFACATTCSIGNTYVVIVDVNNTRVFATIDVGGAIIMISHNFFSKKSFILSFQSA